MERIVSKYKIVARSLLIVFWVFGTYMFPIQEAVPAIAPAAASIGSLLSDAAIILLGLWTLHKRIDIILYAVLVLIGITSAIINDIPLVMAINGMRFYLIAVSILPIIRYLLATHERVSYFIPLMDRSLYAFLLLQMPVMVFQCIRWGAFDNVGGTLGWNMSGTISTLIYIISFYLMVRRWDSSKSYLGNLRQNIILVVALLSSMLNETKISFIYLVLYFFFLIPMDRNYIKRMVYLAPIIVIMICGFGYVYSRLLSDSYSYISDYGSMTSMDFFSSYTFGDDNARTLVLDGYLEQVMPEVEEADFARGLKYSTLPIILSDTPHSWYVGFGPSQYKGWTTLELTPFAQQYEWLLKGTQMSVMSFVIDLGLAGLLWFVWYLLVLFRSFRHVKKRDKRLTWFLSLITILAVCYMPMHIYIVFMIIFVYTAMLSSREPLFKFVPQPTGWWLKPLPKESSDEQADNKALP